MILLVFIFIAVVFVPWPWTLLVLALGIVAEIGEVIWGRRLARRHRPRAGSETLIGARGEVVEASGPDGRGRIRIQGELWEAQSAEPFAVGDTVVVTSRDELTLAVKKEAPSGSAAISS
jgi:membrane-bound serine protease (ClpP class)